MSGKWLLIYSDYLNYNDSFFFRNQTYLFWSTLGTVHYLYLGRDEIDKGTVYYLCLGREEVAKGTVHYLCLGKKDNQGNVH